jgi:hypothetical protein
LAESIDEIVYPLDEIEAFFKAVHDGTEPRINERIAYICSFFAERRVEALRETAREVDETYRSLVRDEVVRPRKGRRLLRRLIKPRK